MSYSLSLSRGKLQNLSTYFSSNKTLKINVFKQLDFLSFILEMQRYLHCKLHKIHSYVLAVIDWFLHKEFTTTEKYLHFFLENTTSCKLPVSKTWIAKACPLLIHHRDKTQHYAGIGAQSLCVYSLGSHILISNYYFVLWNMSFSCWFLGTSHCQVPVCESGRICCFKQHFACFELETININNLANLLKMFTDGSGSFYKSKLRSFQRHKLYIYSVQSENAFTERVLMILRRNSEEELPSLYICLWGDAQTPSAQWSYTLSWAVKNEASRRWFGCLNEVNLASTFCVDSNFNSSLRKASVYWIILLHFLPPTLYLCKKTLFNGLWRSAELFLNAVNTHVLNFLK